MLEIDRLTLGLPVTLCCTFGAPLINIGVFAILYPIVSPTDEE